MQSELQEVLGSLNQSCEPDGHSLQTCRVSELSTGESIVAADQYHIND